MAQINLKDYYPNYYHEDYIIDAPDDVVELLQSSRRYSEKVKRNIFRYHAQYSLDSNEMYESEVLNPGITPQELLEQFQTSQALSEAISELSTIQAKRIVQKYFDKIPVSEIAKMEGVSLNSVKKSINRGLLKLKEYFDEK